MEISRPASRIEIVAAMRRVRYEFKARGIKKKKVDIAISVDGVKIVLKKKKKGKWAWDESQLLVMYHPVYRIFYVSHDSQDLQIFSYIARDGATNTFKCNVFKCSKKSQAMRIVRTIGQAFEVCHKVAQQQQLAQEAESEESGHKPDSGHLKREMTLPSIEDERLKEMSESRSVSPIPVIPPPSEPPPPAPFSNPSRNSGEKLGKRESVSSVVTGGSAGVGAGKEAEDEPGPIPSSFSGLPPHPSSAHHSNIPSSQTWHPGQQFPQGQIPSYFAQPGSSLYSSVNRDGAVASSTDAYAYGGFQPPFVSPYATLQLPGVAGAGAAGAQVLPSGLTSPPIGTLSPTERYSMTRQLDNFSMSLVRSQMDQAQQQAQVAVCQVQLLRDQLSAETTARLEAQARTSQLLNANKELLEQVQGLVGRMQALETRISTDPATIPGFQYPTSSMPHLPQPLQPHYSFQQQPPNPREPSNPHQTFLATLPTPELQTVSSSNIPQKVERTMSLPLKTKSGRQAAEHLLLAGGHQTTDPGSTTDTTDYSSSDQYASGSGGGAMARAQAKFQPGTAPDLGIFMANPAQALNIPPNVMLQLQEHWKAQMAQAAQAQAQPTSDSPTTSGKLEKQDSDESKSDSKEKLNKKDKGKILGGEKEFSRMSFGRNPLESIIDRDSPKKEAKRSESIQENVIQEEGEEEGERFTKSDRSDSVITVKENPASPVKKWPPVTAPPPHRTSGISHIVGTDITRHNMSIDLGTMSGPLVNGPMSSASARSSVSTSSEITPPNENHASAGSLDSNAAYAAQLAASTNAITNDIAALHSALSGLQPGSEPGTPFPNMMKPQQQRQQQPQSSLQNEATPQRRGDDYRHINGRR